jgi:hypothetical protein
MLMMDYRDYCSQCKDETEINEYGVCDDCHIELMSEKEEQNKEDIEYYWSNILVGLDYKYRSNNHD